MKYVRICFALIIITSALHSAQTTDFQVSVFAGVNHYFKYGSVEDYVFSGNDFPVTPAHNSLNLGFSAAYYFSSKIGLEFEGRYYIFSKVTLEDPSDLDTVDFKTASHVSAALNLKYLISSGKLQPYLTAGAGVDKISAGNQTAFTKYGFEIQFIRPEKTVDFFLHAGGGIEYYLRSDMGIRLDIRYALVFDDSRISSLNPSIGVFFRF